MDVERGRCDVTCGDAVVGAFISDRVQTVTNWLGLNERLLRIATP